MTLSTALFASVRFALVLLLLAVLLLGAVAHGTLANEQVANEQVANEQVQLLSPAVDADEAREVQEEQGESKEEALGEKSGQAHGSSLDAGASNVSAIVDRNGNLIVTGDNGDNCISWSPTNIGEGSLLGCDGTLVNGGPSTLIFGATNDFRFDMRGGNDIVRVRDGDGNTAPDDLEIKTGSGNDRVEVSSFHILDDLIIDTGSGHDAVTIDPGFTVFVEDKTDIDTGSGNDEVLIRSSPSITTFFHNDFSLKTGSGRDFVHVCGAGFRNRVAIDLGRGDDRPNSTGDRGGLCVDGNTVFDNADVLDDVEFDGGSGTDEYAIEFVTGIAPPGVLDDFLRHFELQADECSFLGGKDEDCNTLSNRSSWDPSPTERSAATRPTDVQHRRAFGATEIRYSLAEDGPVQLSIFDIRGRLVRTVVSEHKQRGDHSATWDEQDRNGSPVAAGVYFYRFHTAAFAAAKKLVVVR